MHADTLGLRVALGGSIGLVLVYLIAVHTASGQHVDDLMMSVLARSDAGWAEAVLAVVSPTSVLVASLTITLLAALVGGGRAAVAAAVTAVGTVVAAQVLKAVLSRPTLLDEMAANSLPSGHVAAVAGVAVAAVLAAPVDLRWFAGLAGIVAVALTGLATVVLEWHRPSDVVAAALLALTAGGLARSATAASSARGRTAVPASR